jgi:O-antigen ligase
MSIVAVMPFALWGVFAARRRWVKVAFAAIVAAQLTCVVLTHSRSGSIAAAIAALLFVFRGKGGSARGALAAGAIAVALAAFAPTTFWQRSRTITHLEDDESVTGREHAWKVLGVVVEERPLTGVGAGAFLTSWGRYAPLEAGGHRYVAHNVLLEIVGDLGIVAFLLWVAYAVALLWRLWRAGSDPLVGGEARAVFAALVGYLVVEMVNGYSLSWFLYFLFACAAAAIRLAGVRASLAGEEA